MAKTKKQAGAEKHQQGRVAYERAVRLASVWMRHDPEDTAGADIITAAVVRIASVLAEVKDDKNFEPLVKAIADEIRAMSKTYEDIAVSFKLDEIVKNQKAS